MSADECDQYFYSDGENATGPLSLDKLQQMVEIGIISYDVSVAKAETNNWVSLASLIKLPVESQIAGNTAKDNVQNRPGAVPKTGKRKLAIYTWYAVCAVLVLAAIVATLNGHVLFGLILLIGLIRGIACMVKKFRNRNPDSFIKDLVRDSEQEAEKAFNEEILHPLQQELRVGQSVRNSLSLVGKIVLGFIIFIVLVGLTGAAIDAIAN